MVKIVRKYRAKDVELLTVGESIVDHAIEHKDFLISKRPSWADPFLPDLKTSIETAFSDHLGIDNAKEMREATQVVNNLQKTALTFLAEFKVQVEEDFKKNKTRRAEILNQLGFTTYLKGAQHGSHEELVNLLYQFKTNMKPALKTEITTAGTAPAEIDAIIAQTQILKDSGITQETLKGERKELTQEAIREFNDIYDQVISIAKIAAKFFKQDKAVKDEFSFSKAIKAISGEGSGDSKNPATPAPPAK
ncbi:MAG: hypothetical protein HY951_00010 [Bacteroidia bacterium]|nr:hypothetical protein [Bacteroidia bacterium]